MISIRNPIFIIAVVIIFIFILVLILPFLFPCPRVVNEEFHGVDAIKKINEFGLSIPDEANDVWFGETTVFVQWIYIRFDTDKKRLEEFLSKNERLPGINTLNTDVELQKHIHVVGNHIKWWKPDEIKMPLCGKTEGKRSYNNSDWGWGFSICCGKIEKDVYRIYVVFFEDPR